MRIAHLEFSFISRLKTSEARDISNKNMEKLMGNVSEPLFMVSTKQQAEKVIYLSTIYRIRFITSQLIGCVILAN